MRTKPASWIPVFGNANQTNISSRVRHTTSSSIYWKGKSMSSKMTARWRATKPETASSCRVAANALGT